MQAMRAGQYRETVSTDRQQAHMTNRQLAGIADDQVQSADQHPVGTDQRREMQLVEIARPPRKRDQRCRHNQDGYRFLGRVHQNAPWVEAARWSVRFKKALTAKYAKDAKEHWGKVNRDRGRHVKRFGVT